MARSRSSPARARGSGPESRSRWPRRVPRSLPTEDKPLEEVDDESLDLVIKSGIYGSLYAMQACFPDMKARGGRIVNLGSGAATVGLPEVGAYAIAKEDIRGLTKVAAVSRGKYDITANTICPMVTSSLYNRWWPARTEAERARHMDAIPMRGWATPKMTWGPCSSPVPAAGSSRAGRCTLTAAGGFTIADRVRGACPAPRYIV
jgi:2-hydroxycyclohexanecarboxyl-CoA dehydrogenase